MRTLPDLSAGDRQRGGFEDEEVNPNGEQCEDDEESLRIHHHAQDHCQDQDDYIVDPKVLEILPESTHSLKHEQTRL